MWLGSTIRDSEEIKRLRSALEPERLKQIIGSRWMGNLSEQELLDETVAEIRSTITE